MRWGAMVCAVLLVAPLAGCGGVISAADAGPVPFPECEADAYAFVGTTSLAAIGLPVPPEEAGRVGRIFVTAGPPDPADWATEPGPPGQERMMCVEWPDGSGVIGPIPDDWSPPGAGLSLPVEAGSPITLVAVVVALALVAGVSLLAFGWRPGGHGSR